MFSGKLFSKLYEIAGMENVKDVGSWQIYLVRALCVAMSFGLPLSFPPTFGYYLRDRLYGLIVIDLLVWIYAILVGFHGRGLFRPRPWLALSIVLGLAMTFIVNLGLGQSRSAWLVAFVTLAALLHGVTGALITTLINVAMLSILFFWMAPDTPAWTATLDEPLDRQVMYIINVSLIGLACALPAGLLLRGLGKVLIKEQEARRQLLEERAELEEAYRRLMREAEQRQTLEQSLRQAQKLKALGIFAGGIAHDLNNELVPIVGYSEVLTFKLSEDSPDRDKAEAILSAAERARELVQQVLLFSREVPPADEYIDIERMLTEVASSIETSLPSNVALDIELQKTDTVHGNRSSLFQVFKNLVTNALAAMKDDGGTLTVKLAELDDDDLGAEVPAMLDNSRRYLVVMVRDTGNGMDEETASRVFEPFFTTKPVGEGTGLGLATSHGVATALGGDITVHSEVGKGTTFHVFLPSSGGVDARDSRRMSFSGTNLFTGRVLLVDDNVNSREPVEAMLRELGFEVTTADDGSSALEMIENLSKELDIVVTDLNMPEMNGLELARHIKKGGPSLPVMLISGFLDADATAEASRIGVDQIMAKPFSPAELHKKIHKIFKKRRASH